MRYSRSSRILKSFDFQRLKENGNRFQSKHLVVLKTKGLKSGCRLGIIVSKKTGGAVIRNRWKRVLREAFRTQMADQKWVGDHLVIVRRGMAGKPSPTMKEEFVSLMNKAQTR